MTPSFGGLPLRAMFTLSLFCLAGTTQAEEIDASDPTRIYTYAGPGFKYTEFSNGDSLSELRIQGNLALSQNDMMLFEMDAGLLERADGHDLTGYGYAVLENPLSRHRGPVRELLAEIVQ